MFVAHGTIRPERCKCNFITKKLKVDLNKLRTCVHTSWSGCGFCFWNGCENDGEIGSGCESAMKIGYENDDASYGSCPRSV